MVLLNDLILDAFFGLVLGIVVVALLEYLAKDDNDNNHPDIDDFRIYE